MAVSSDGRAFVRYTDDTTGTVALPGYLNPIPAHVAPGDVVSIDGEFVDEVTAGGRFEETDAPDEGSSPNARLTKAELAEKVNAGRDADDPERVDPADYDKDGLVALADEYDRTHPEPIGATGDTDNPERLDR